MAQYAWILEVRPGYEEEYVRRHQEIWPEMVEALREAGIRNYSIFRYGLTLFGYFETDEIEKTQEHLANSETNQQWREWMDPIMKVHRAHGGFFRDAHMPKSIFFPEPRRLLRPKTRPAPDVRASNPSQDVGVQS